MKLPQWARRYLPALSKLAHEALQRGGDVVLAEIDRATGVRLIAPRGATLAELRSLGLKPAPWEPRKGKAPVMLNWRDGKASGWCGIWL